MSFACRRPAGEGSVVNPLPIPNLSDLVASPGSASCSVVLGTNGTGSYDGLGAPVNFNWFLGAPITSIGNNYWARLTVNSGTVPSGDLSGTWLQLNAARTWAVNRSGIGTNSGNYTLQIASDSGGVNIVGAVTFTMSSQVTP